MSRGHGLHTCKHSRQGDHSMNINEASLSKQDQCANYQGDHSFSTMIFHDFSMTKKWISMTYRHNIFFEINDTRFMNAYQNKKKFSSSSSWLLSYDTNTGVCMYTYLQVFQCYKTTNRVVFTETNILMHFYKKNSWISSLFSMTFHDLGCFPWLSRPGKWSY